MAKFDLAINDVQLPSGEVASIGVCGEKIAEIASTTLVSASEVIDAQGLLALPGLVDAHVHFRDPGNAHKEGFENGSRAALNGGVTTVVIMPTDNPMTSDAPTFHEKVSLGARSYNDFAIAAISGPDTASIAALANLGCCSIELFFSDIPDRFLIEGDDELERILTQIKITGRRAGITPVVESLVAPLSREFVESGRLTAADFINSRPPNAESVGVEKACAAAVRSDCPIHIRQVSCRSSVDVLRRYKTRYPELITAETLPHYLFLTEETFSRMGVATKMSPPLRRASDVEALWQGLREGLIDIVTTDHAPHLIEEKLNARSFWEAPSGVPGLETMLALLLKGVDDGRLSVLDVVRFGSEMPARLFGLYPRKGAIGINSDADIILIDPEHRYVIRGSDHLSRAKGTPFEGMSVRGRLKYTLLRGRVVQKDGKLGHHPNGAFIPFVGRGAISS